MPCAQRGPRRARGRAHRLGQDRDRRVRRAPGARPRAASASTPRRSRRCPTRSTPTWSRRYGSRTRGPAHRGQQHQRRRAGGGDDHRGAPQHAVHAGRWQLAGLGYVVMDEVHYLADRFRGAVWEEVIIHLPDIGRAGGAVRHGEQRRGVRRLAGHRPRRHRGHRRRAPAGAAVAARAGRAPAVRPVRPTIEHAARVDPELLAAWPSGTRPGSAQGAAATAAAAGTGRAGSGRLPARRASTRLDRDGLLPAITFIFSRAGCDAAVEQCLRAGLRLTTPDEARRDPRRSSSAAPPTSRRGPGRARLLASGCDGLRARHRRAPRRHAARPSRRSSRSCSRAGLVKAVFATETLALGINMPARTVVIERLVKWNGETPREPDRRGVHPAHRAGRPPRHRRRGPRGGALAAGHRPGAVAGLACTRTYPLRLELPALVQHGRQPGRLGRPGPRLRPLLESSFAQFQADRGVIGLTRQVTQEPPGHGRAGRGDELR